MEQSTKILNKHVIQYNDVQDYRFSLQTQYQTALLNFYFCQLVFLR